MSPLLLMIVLLIGYRRPCRRDPLLLSQLPDLIGDGVRYVVDSDTFNTSARKVAILRKDDLE